MKILDRVCRSNFENYSMQIGCHTKTLAVAKVFGQ